MCKNLHELDKERLVYQRRLPSDIRTNYVHCSFVLLLRGTVLYEAFEQQLPFKKRKNLKTDKKNEINSNSKSKSSEFQRKL